jgi:hypothetical protein
MGFRYVGGHWAAAAILLILVSASDPVQSDTRKIIGVEYICALDGATEARFLVREGDRGRVESRLPEDIPQLVQETFPKLAAGKRLTPFTAIPYPMEPDGIDKLEIRLNHLAATRRGLYKDVVRALINPLRGTRSKPRLVIKSGAVDTRGYSDEDFVDDGINMIYVHEDDRTWDTGYIGHSVGMARVYFDYRENRFLGADVTFTYRLYTDEIYQRQVQCLIHEYGHVFGYWHTGWPEDVMCYSGPWYIYRHQWHGFEDAFFETDSFLWQMSQAKDRLLYGGELVDGVYTAEHEILPLDGALIDLEHLGIHPDHAYLGRHVIAMTTLKGYRGKPLELTIYRGDEARENRRILSIKGYHPTLADPDYQALLDDYQVSYLYLNKQGDFRKLERAVRRHGEPLERNTLSYSHALPCTLEVTGYEGPDSQDPATRQSRIVFAIRQD